MESPHILEIDCNVLFLKISEPNGKLTFLTSFFHVSLYFLQKKSGKDASKDQRAVQKLRREVEKAKRALSSAHTARVEVESLHDGEDFSETLSRAKFEELNIVSF